MSSFSVRKLSFQLQSGRVPGGLGPVDFREESIICDEQERRGCVMSKGMGKRKGSVLPADGLQQTEAQNMQIRARNYASVLYFLRAVC